MELVEIREQFPKSFFIKGVEEFGGDTENGTMDYSTFSKFMQALRALMKVSLIPAIWNVLNL